MHILLVADGRSPITRNWIQMLSDLEYKISLISTFPCQPVPGIEFQHTLPIAFSSMAGSQVAVSKNSRKSFIQSAVAHMRPLLLRVRALAAPLTLAAYKKDYLRIIEELKPDIVHALRIPYEGMLAAITPAEIPLIVSIWGNDLTLHAQTSPSMARHTRCALQRADGLLADAQRDLHLAEQWGLRAGIPAAVLPGSGGLDLGEIKRSINPKNNSPFQLPKDRPIVVNPRGFRPGSVHQDVFFRCLPKVLKEFPRALFVCTAMRGQPLAAKWIETYHLQDNVLLLPYLDQQDLWQLFSRSLVYVSLSSHDGTPNTFLEALACGCFPVVGDIESLREWLEDDKNGLLVNPRSAEAAAEAIKRALRDEALRRQAHRKNTRILKERAEIRIVRQKAASFYKQISHT